MEDDHTINEESISSALDQSPSDLQIEEAHSRSKAKKPLKKVIINISLTKYSVVRKVAKHFKWKLSKNEEDENWDVFWTDAAVQPEKLSRMKHYQKINHFPGMYALARKNYLAKNLKRMQKPFPKEFGFFPKTWLIPAEYSDLLLYANGKKKKVFIVKPEASCQGRGIFLTKKVEEFSLDDRYVVQEYLQRPLLIDGLKFDLRIYVLLAGCNPLRIYLFNEGLARFATETYVKPSGQNLAKQCVHLTNYAINKNNSNFVFNEDPDLDDVGHKRSLTSTFKMLSDQGHDTAKLWDKIKDLIIKTLCSVQPSLAHTYKACQPDDSYNGMCFEILGFDVILDHKLKPWLLEVNHSPSFTTDSPLDLKIKFDLISQTLDLLNINTENRVKFMNKQKKEIIERSVSKSFPKSKDKKLEEIEKAQKMRNKWENKHLGDFVRIYDESNSEKYQKFIETAAENWKEWTGGKKKESQKVENKTNSSVRQSSNLVSPAEKTDKSSVFERLSQKTSKKPSIEKGVFPGVKLDESDRVCQLPLFVEICAKDKNQKVYRMNEFQSRTDKTKFSDLPILIQSMIGNDKNESRERLAAKIRNMTPGYRKKPYQYMTNLSYYKKWDLNE